MGGDRLNQPEEDNDVFFYFSTLEQYIGIFRDDVAKGAELPEKKTWRGYSRLYAAWNRNRLVPQEVRSRCENMCRLQVV
jgi:hypothetical protein